MAASAGNHALALSYHGHSLGIPVTVVMPIVAPIMKLSACRQFGANVIVKGDDIGEVRPVGIWHLLFIFLINSEVSNSITLHL